LSVVDVLSKGLREDIAEKEEQIPARRLAATHYVGMGLFNLRQKCIIVLYVIVAPFG